MSERIPSMFGCQVFNEDTMAKYVSCEAVVAWKQCLKDGTSLQLDTANDIADGMKTWALEHGATHYTHWFQPMTGYTAEKHDSFISPVPGGKVIMDFSGKELVRGESDASSFPSGGLRATFEARGYTAWDPTSFAFLKDGSLCIPTIFCSYSGEALDKKTPLLRSMDAVSRQAVRVLRLFGDHQTTKVTANIGPEQEYFLLDKELYMQREDLKLCGRTLFGSRAPKGQELDDHYYGAIKPRVAAYMKDLDEELWKLGVSSKTKHNEVAPSQHEMAPVYSDANTACDHNQLTMETMKRVADRHGLVCLLHEKPFAGINGSGKHDNWSLGTNTGKNLFAPGKTPSQNAQFLLFLAAFVKGVDEYQELLRSTVATAGNDHRLGAQEAPPAIISIFVGKELSDIIESITEGTDYVDVNKRSLQIGVDVLPPIPQDTTDRNRTSPLAFTGNKFEFRMPGASMSVSGPTVVLNAIMAEELRQFADALENSHDFQGDLHNLIRQALTDHKRILFDGNGYDESWVEEAQRRGLKNLYNAPLAMPAFILPKNITLMTRHGIFTEGEMLARHEIHMENYCKVIRIEALTLVDIIQRQLLNAASQYSSDLCSTILTKRAALPGVACRGEEALAESICHLNNDLLEGCADLKTAVNTVPKGLTGEALVNYYHDEVFARMQKVRAIIDHLETLVAADYWPVPTYYDLLFSV
ncbi:MAG: glutamine synthetase III [Clostridia bacterium]|nr:glutamine synthetase III [Clostridia bacterium]